MSASAPLTGSPSRNDWLLVHQLGHAQVWDNLQACTTYCNAVAPVLPSFILAADPLPLVVLANFRTWALISITGTTTPYQWLLNANSFPLADAWKGGGQLCNGFQQIAVALYPQLLAYAQEVAVPIVVVGHSLGGAVAQMVTAFFLADHIPVHGCYVGGSPRPGDALFAGTIDSFVWSLIDIGDWVPSLPPQPGQIPAFLPYPWSNLLPDQPTANPGTLTGLGPQGQFFEPAVFYNFSQLFTLASNGQGQAHLAGTYAGRLKRGGAPAIDQFPGAWGYNKPWLLYDLQTQPPPPVLNPVTSLLGYLTASQVAGMQCQGTCFSAPGLPPG